MEFWSLTMRTAPSTVTARDVGRPDGRNQSSHRWNTDISSARLYCGEYGPNLARTGFGWRLWNYRDVKERCAQGDSLRPRVSGEADYTRRFWKIDTNVDKWFNKRTRKALRRLSLQLFSGKCAGNCFRRVKREEFEPRMARILADIRRRLARSWHHAERDGYCAMRRWNSSSEMTGMPSCLALSSLLPASSPART